MPDARPLLVIGLGAVADRTADLLGAEHTVMRAMDFGEVPPLQEVAAVAFAADRPYPQHADALDVECWRTGTPWCAAFSIASGWTVGPAVVPPRTPCHRCWARRTAAAAADIDTFDMIQKLATTSNGSWFRGRLPALDEQLSALLAAETVWLLGRDLSDVGIRQGRFWSGDVIAGTMDAHRFDRIGGCSQCDRTAAARGRSSALADPAR